MHDAETVTQLLVELSDGNDEAMDELMPIVYEELRSIARGQLRGERNGHTFSTTALVHEAYLKLVKLDRIQWKNRTQFFAIAAQAMRRILINYAEKRNAQKRGGGAPKLSLKEGMAVSEEHIGDLLALNEAMTRLEAMNPRQSRVVECRFFAGMTIQETADALDVSPATVKRDWTAARAWLNRELSAESDSS